MIVESYNCIIYNFYIISKGQNKPKLYCCISNPMYYTCRLYSIVHGKWGAWGAWSSCSEMCGNGISTRYKSCNNPAPAHGGSYCPVDILRSHG
jgi:hypothetical protein